MTPPNIPNIEPCLNVISSLRAILKISPNISVKESSRREFGENHF